MKTGVATAYQMCSRFWLVALLVVFVSGTSEAGLITESGDLLTVSSDKKLASHTFAGQLQQQLIIDLSSQSLAIQGGTPQGVSVINGRLFVGLVSSIAAFTPKIVELNPLSGGVINLMNTATPQLTALGDDGTNLLLLNSLIFGAVTGWDVHSYSTSGALQSTVRVDRQSPSNFQGEGIDGDGQSLFMSTQSGFNIGQGQMVITDTAAGVAVSQFDTGMQPLTSFIGGLAYNWNDDTLWIAGSSEFRHFDRSGNLLAAVPTGLGNTGVTGLEVIAPSQAVPEPSTLASVMALICCTTGLVLIRRRTQSQRLPA